MIPYFFFFHVSVDHMYYFGELSIEVQISPLCCLFALLYRNLSLYLVLSLLPVLLSFSLKNCCLHGVLNCVLLCSLSVVSLIQVLPIGL